jgi:hypothetical protein
LEGVEAGRQVLVFKIDPANGETLGLLATATVGQGGWAFCLLASCMTDHGTNHAVNSS